MSHPVHLIKLDVCMPSCTAGPNMFPGYKTTHGNTLLHRHGYIQEIDKQQPECHCLFHAQAQRERDRHRQVQLQGSNS